MTPAFQAKALLLMGMRHSDRARLGRFLVLAAIAICLGTARAAGQFASSNQFTLSEAQVDAVDSTVEGELAAIDALVSDRHWDEAAERLRALAERRDERVVEVDKESGLYLSLEKWCQRLISRLPPPALAIYRSRVDGLAQAWLQDAIAERNEPLLEQITHQLFASTFGDDALLALGELALERGDYSAARRAWERITPIARGPEGRPLWIALAGMDVRARWPEIELLLADRGPTPKWLVYPDTDLDAAQVLARLVLVSVREGAFDRARTELAVLEGLFPEATGVWGGKNVLLGETLQGLLAEASTWEGRPRNGDWPTFAGSAARNGIAGPMPEAVGHVVWRVSLPTDEGGPDGRQLGRGNRIERRLPDASERPPAVHPILLGDTLLYNDNNRVYALDIANGESAVAGRSDCVLHAPEREPSRAAFQPGRGRTGVPRFTLTAGDGIVFARTGSPLTTRAENTRLAGDEGLVGLEVAGGRLDLKVEPPGQRWAFEGPPLVDGDRVIVAVRQSDVRPRALVACYSRTSGQLLWQTFVAAGDTAARPGWEEVTHNLLTFAGDTVYYNTNLGVIASLATRDGRIRWIKRYDRAPDGDLSRLADHFHRDLSPCVYHHGLLYSAPADSPYIFALDAVTGETIWANNEAHEAVHLLGVAGHRLIASGNQIWWIDAESGSVLARWPEGPGAGLHAYGRGLIAGDCVLWPTREQRIFVLDVLTARQQREPIDLRPLDVKAGNLLLAGETLIVAGGEEIVALGRQPPARRPEDDEAEVALLRTPRKQNRK